MIKTFNVILSNEKRCKVEIGEDSYRIFYEDSFRTNHIYNHGSSLKLLFDKIISNKKHKYSGWDTIYLGVNSSSVTVGAIDTKTIKEIFACMLAADSLLSSRQSKYTLRDSEIEVNGGW